MKVTRKVWSYYQEYLATLGGSTPGVFLVAMDGDVARGARYMYCPVQYDRCSAKGGGPVNETNRMCIKDHLTCVLFARNSQIQVPYEIIDLPFPAPTMSENRERERSRGGRLAHGHLVHGPDSAG